MGVNISRITRLRIWLLEHDIAMRTIAEQLGMSRQRVGFLLKAKTMTPEMHRRFVEAGIPADLLPPAEERRYGPSRREGTLCLNPATAG